VTRDVSTLSCVRGRHELALGEPDQILRLGPAGQALEVRADVSRVVGVSLREGHAARPDGQREHAAAADPVPVERLGHHLGLGLGLGLGVGLGLGFGSGLGLG
jgi:hypothetical protein